MTFDEAVREYELRSSIGPLVQGIKISPFVNVPQQEYDRVKFMNNLFYETINKLRNEYAPTVVMTEIQKNALVEFKENWAFTQFINAVEGNYENNMYFKKVEEAFLKMRINNGYMIDENELMQAWLHPETIKEADG